MLVCLSTPLDELFLFLCAMPRHWISIDVDREILATRNACSGVQDVYYAQDSTPVPHPHTIPLPPQRNTTNSAAAVLVHQVVVSKDWKLLCGKSEEGNAVVAQVQQLLAKYDTDC